MTGSRLVARLAGPYRSATQQTVLAELRRVILAGHAPPDTTVPIDEVAARFGVSVNPVREALRTLIGEGLADQQPRGGYTVARLTELKELYVVRGVLEQAAVAAAVARSGPDGEYHYSRGYNPVAIAATVAGAALAMAVVLLGTSEAAAFSWFIGAGIAFAIHWFAGRSSVATTSS